MISTPNVNNPVDSFFKIISEKLSAGIKRITEIGGGCINHAQKLETSDGTFFLKWNGAKQFPGMFDAEAKGLALLRSTATLKIPEVLFCGEAEEKYFLVLEWIESGARQKNFWKNFGVSLAMLHRQNDTVFGLDHNNYIGSLPQSNHQHNAWIGFFIEERLEKQIAIAKESGAISTSTMKQFDNLCIRLSEIIPEERPALLHGDLWNGNFMTAVDGSACLIDPAVYYGHRETDLAMTKLFGGFSDPFYDAYNETFPLEKNFESRIDIHNLYPLLVHVNLFGGGYAEQVKSILSRF